MCRIVGRETDTYVVFVKDSLRRVVVVLMVLVQSVVVVVLFNTVDVHTKNDGWKCVGRSEFVPRQLQVPTMYLHPGIQA